MITMRLFSRLHEITSSPEGSDTPSFLSHFNRFRNYMVAATLWVLTANVGCQSVTLRQPPKDHPLVPSKSTPVSLDGDGGQIVDHAGYYYAPETERPEIVETFNRAAYEPRMPNSVVIPQPRSTANEGAHLRIVDPQILKSPSPASSKNEPDGIVRMNTMTEEVVGSVSSGIKNVFSVLSDLD